MPTIDYKHPGFYFGAGVCARIPALRMGQRVDALRQINKATKTLKHNYNNHLRIGTLDKTLLFYRPFIWLKETRTETSHFLIDVRRNLRVLRNKLNYKQT